MKYMKIIFIGGVKFSHEILEAILKGGFSIDAVFSYEESKKKIYSDYISFDEITKKYKIKHVQVMNINDIKNVELIKKIQPDLILVMGWSQLLKNEILKIPQIGVIGSHPTELPKYRGRAPIPWTILKNLKKSAETFFWIEEGTDSGDILDQEIFLINNDEDAKSLYHKITDLGKKMILKNLKLIEQGVIIRKKQDSTKFIENWNKRTIEDGKINWTCLSNDIYKLIRATTDPYPGAFTFFRNGKVKIWKALLSTKTSSKPGRIMQINDLGVFIGTGDNMIIIQDISFENDIQIKANKFFLDKDIGYVVE
jgi:methionyl-tRNA formyltransferase